MGPPFTPELTRPKTRRLFFALWPGQSLQQQLYELAGQTLKANAGRRVAAENMHLTLAFLGAVTEPDQARYEAAASAVRGSAFTLTFDQLGCFRRAGILWVGPSQIPAELLALVRDLNQALQACGFTLESREYRAHLTLARDVRHCPDCASVLSALVWDVRHFALVQSHTGSHGATYEVLRRWDLV
ncbi:MAG: RNA 2',3'-cyclic phosphodiesterase [Pseudomonadota bacterium]